MLLNHDQVKTFLPHRKPFLFIDTVESLFVPPEKEGNIITPRDLVGVKVIAHFEVKADLEILKGHFPGKPILPGVVQIELMAQASAFVSLPLNNLSIAGLDVETLLISVEKSKFRKLVVPGMKLEIHATMIKNRGTIASYHAEVFCESEKISEAEFMAKLEIKKDSKKE
jgi:3-hydroxyacyl-[acyl-carrier-protein] dehydratase